jgi:Tol biopolymer transport system component/C-terminal processing protease CtpA/Prc
MKSLPLVLSIGLAMAGIAPHAVAQRSLPAYSSPAISPAGAHIAFVSGGSIFETAGQGGMARILVGGPDSGDDHPLYAQDGKSLAFQQTRGSARGIYILDLVGGGVRRLTWDDGSDLLDAWSADGRWLYFSSARGNVEAAFRGIYKVAATGGTPIPVVNGIYKDQEMATVSADGSQVAFSYGGLVGWQWWRDGSSHIDTGAIWSARASHDAPFRRLTPDDARAEWPMWAPGGEIYYVSDRSGSENIWRSDADGKQLQLTRFKDGRVLWPRLDATGHAMVFERDFGIWRLDLAGANPVAHRVAIEQRAGSTPDPDRWLPVNGKITTSALAADGKTLAMVVRGQIMLGDRKEPHATIALDLPLGQYSDLGWTPDGASLIYRASRAGHWGVYRYGIGSHKENLILADESGDFDQPQISPDGRQVAAIRNQTELRIAPVSGGGARSLVHDQFEVTPPLASPHTLAWSPDGKWLAYLAIGPRNYANLKLARLRDGRVVTATDLGNTEGSDVVWSPAGDVIYFVSGQRTEKAQVARVVIRLKQPRFASDALRARWGAKAAGGDSSFDGNLPAGDRLSFLPLDSDVADIALGHQGKWLVFAENKGDDQYLYAAPIDSVNDRSTKILLSGPDSKVKPSKFLDPQVADISLTGDDKHLSYLEHGVAKNIDVDLGQDVIEQDSIKRSEIDFDGQVRSSFEKDKMVDFDQVWSMLKGTFFDQQRTGESWSQVRRKYEPYIQGAQDTHTLYRLLGLMIGELNSSHSGAFEPADARAISQGFLGIDFDVDQYLKNGKYVVSNVLAGGPAAVDDGLVPGDELLRIDGQVLTADSNIDSYLANEVGKPCDLQLRGANGKVRHLIVKPISVENRQDLVYQAWTASNRSYVSRISHGRLGYLHLRDMTEPSLAQFYKDLNASNAQAAGVVVDVRNNFGGFVNAYVLDALSRRDYMSMQPRGFSAAFGARATLGQRLLDKPTVAVTNRVTLSDGEDFTEGYRALGLGKVVGEPTAGWIIYTSGAKLLDGGAVRLPFIRITGRDGNDMEQHPRPVDLPVPVQPSNGYGADDGYLDQAIKAMQ